MSKSIQTFETHIRSSLAWPDLFSAGRLLIRDYRRPLPPCGEKVWLRETTSEVELYNFLINEIGFSRLPAWKRPTAQTTGLYLALILSQSIDRSYILQT